MQFHATAVMAQSIMHHESTRSAIDGLRSSVDALKSALERLPSAPTDAAGSVSSRRRPRPPVTGQDEQQPETPKWTTLMAKLPMRLPLRSKQQLIDLHRHLGGSSADKVKKNVKEFLLEVARVRLNCFLSLSKYFCGAVQTCYIIILTIISSGERSIFKVDEVLKRNRSVRHRGSS